MPAGGAMTRGPRILLRQIREALGAGAAPAQDRLDMVVRIIARSMVAEVCSIYLRRASGELELFATEGLNPDAVHNTRLRAGEGLVGEVARLAQPVSLSDAPSHPSFSYRPETGEDPYHAFLGAPLRRGGRASGVRFGQNRIERRFDEDEVEADPARDEILRFRVTIRVERDSQKAIVIGAGGSRMKQVGTRARREIEALLGVPVYLDIRVKVAKDWQRDPKQLRRLGF